MSDIAIRVENLSKAYRIGLKEQRHETLMGAVTSFVRSPFKNYRNLRKLSKFDDVVDGNENPQSAIRNPHSDQPSAFSPQPSDVVWALKDVSFEVKHGEVLGIIGRNGAGKSTLLKILSRITEPTSGFAEVYGRVGSLLEVGTGFHPDLTGRENVYLNGTILGMKKREVDATFDEIVDFSGVEKFIDTPVKRYSSGMRVRLAFSVAAHLEPEILLVDEVLAVGDLEFQRKCLGKMEHVAKGGRTILFVSHNMAAVARLCAHAVVLDEGAVCRQGDAADAILLYSQRQQSPLFSGDGAKRQIELWGLELDQGRTGYDPSRAATIRFLLRVNADFLSTKLLLVLRDANQTLLVRDAVSSDTHPQLRAKGTYRAEACIPPLWLTAGQYHCYIKVLGDAGDGGCRYVSDPLLTTVANQPSNKADVGVEVLSPLAQWSFEVTPGC